jgi:hypothetical protein
MGFAGCSKGSINYGWVLADTPALSEPKACNGCDVVYRKGELSNGTIDPEWPHQVALRADCCAGRNYVTIRHFCEGLSLCPLRILPRRMAQQLGRLSTPRNSMSITGASAAYPLRKRTISASCAEFCLLTLYPRISPLNAARELQYKRSYNSRSTVSLSSLPLKNFCSAAWKTVS